MKNHWLKTDVDIPAEITKEMDKEIIADLRVEEDFKSKSFIYELQQHVEVHVESGILTGIVTNRYSTNDGFNWYTISLDRTWQGYDEFTFAEFRVKYCNDWNIVPEYRPGRKRWFDHNYQVVAKENPQITLNPESYMPQKTLNIDLKLKYDAQHDGRLWTPDWKEKCDKRLLEEIMSDLKKQVQEFIASVNPFSVHC